MFKKTHGMSDIPITTNILLYTEVKKFFIGNLSIDIFIYFLFIYAAVLANAPLHVIKVLYYAYPEAATYSNGKCCKGSLKRKLRCYSVRLN